MNSGAANPAEETRPSPMRAAATVLVLALAGAGLGGSCLLQSADHKLLDAQFSLLRALAPRPAAHDVAIVGIDEETVRRFPEPVTLWHPHFGKFLHAAAAGGASAIGMDVVLPDRSYDGIAAGYDKALLASILATRRVVPLVLALTVEPDGRPRQVYPAFVGAAGGDATGYALLPVDGDGVVRRFDERLASDGGTVATFAGQLARRLGATTANRGLLDFSRGTKFAYVPLHEMLAWHDAGDVQSLKAAFSGKPVVLGSVLKFEDRHMAPVNLAAWDREAGNVPGVVLHAQALRNLLGEGLIAESPKWIPALLGAVMALAWFACAGFAIALTLAAAGVLLTLAGSTLLLAQGVFLPPAAGMATLVLAATARCAREAALKLSERRRLRRSFSGYVSPAVMDEILTGKLNPGLGGATRFVCILFSDIRGYTARSERMPPQEVIGFLNRYFEQVVNLIHARGGTVASFMGDGIMAVFGAPKPLDNPCAQAFAAGCDMLDYVQRFNSRLRTGAEPPVEIGIGLHAGDAVVGHVGSSSRHDYTAIGDVTNVASRLEGLTKQTGYRLVFSKVVAQALAGTGGIVGLGVHEIKGHTPVEVFGFDSGQPMPGGSGQPLLEEG